MADVSQIKLPNGSVYDLIDEKSGYITAEYIENKTDYEIPVSRVGEIVVGETAIGTDSTNFPTSKAVVDYVDERVVQEIDAIDVGVTGIKANGTNLSISNGVVNIPVIGPNQSIGLITDDILDGFASYIQSLIPTSTSQLTNNSGFITSETDPTVPAWAKASTKPTYTASEVGALPDSTVIPQIFMVDYNSSTNTANKTYTEINQAYSRGDLVLLKDSNKDIYQMISTDLGYFFATVDKLGSINSIGEYNAKIKQLKVSSSNTWSTINYKLPRKTSDLTNDSGYLTSSDIASVMTYKGTKANYAALPASGNTIGDVWHLTDTGAEWAWDGSAWQELGTAIDLSGYATKATTLSGYGITDAKIQSGTITLGSNTITPLTSFTETDPTVPSWAKQSTKPSYTASEVGAMSTSHAANGITTAKINAWDAKSDFSGSYNDLTDKPTIPTVPTNISAFTNDSGYLTSYTETDPTVPSWAKASTKPSYGLTEISGTDDLRAIEALTGTSGLLKKTAANTWTLDTNTYLTSASTLDATKLSGTIPSGCYTDTNTTYTLSNALASHKFTSTLTAGGSGSGTSTATIEFVAGTGITLTDDTTNKKITIASSVVNTDEKVKTDNLNGTNANRSLVIGNISANSSTSVTNTAYYSNQLYWNDYQHTLTIGELSGAHTSIASTSVGIGNSNNNYFIVLRGTATTSSKNIEFPNASGTVALTSDIPTVYSSTNTGGYLTMATLPIYDGTVV